MSKNIDDFLKNNLRPEEEPDCILNQRILDSPESRVEYKPRSKKNYVIYSFCTLCVCAILCFTTIKLVKVFNNMNYRQSGNGDKSGNIAGTEDDTQFETETEYAITESATKENPDANSNNLSGVISNSNAIFTANYSNIEMNWTSADVNIISHDKNEIMFCYELTDDADKFSEKELPYYEMKDGKLSFYTTSPNVSLKKQVTKSVTLMLPASMAKQCKLSVNLTSCKLNLNLSEIADLGMNMTSCESANVTVDKLNSILLSSTSCANIMYALKNCKQVEIDSASDMITFEVGEKFDFNLVAACTGSEFDIFGEKFNDEHIDDFIHQGSTDNCTINVTATSSNVIFK